MTAERRIVGPAGIDVPRRLPGGVWGPPPCIVRAEWDLNGFPSASWHAAGPLTPIHAKALVAPDDVAASATVQAEMPWPTEWVAFVGVSATRAAPQQPTNPVRVRWAVECGVESSRFRWLFDVDWDGQLTRMRPSEDGYPSGIRLAGQSIRIAPIDVFGGVDQAAAGLTTTLTFAWLLGLTSIPALVR